MLRVFRFSFMVVDKYGNVSVSFLLSLLVGDILSSSLSPLVPCGQIRLDLEYYAAVYANPECGF